MTAHAALLAVKTRSPDPSAVTPAGLSNSLLADGCPLPEYSAPVPPTV